jgi:hypothetical protein
VLPNEEANNSRKSLISTGGQSAQQSRVGFTESQMDLFLRIGAMLDMRRRLISRLRRLMARLIRPFVLHEYLHGLGMIDAPRTQVAVVEATITAGGWVRIINADHREVKPIVA